MWSRRKLVRVFDAGSRGVVCAAAYAAILSPRFGVLRWFITAEDQDMGLIHLEEEQVFRLMCY